MSNNLSLIIYAGKQDTPLQQIKILEIGEIPDKFEPIQPIVVDNDKVWIMCHTRDFNVYEFHTTNAFLVGTGQAAVIHFSLIIPAKTQLMNESPLTILYQIEAAFKRNQMNGMTLNTHIADQTAYTTILHQFTLSEREFFVPVMKGDSPASVEVSFNQLSSIMRFSNYPFFSKLAHLELAFSCNTTIDFKTGKILKGKEIKPSSNDKKTTPDNGNKSSAEKHTDFKPEQQPQEEPATDNNQNNDMDNVVSPLTGGIDLGGGASTGASHAGSYGGGIDLGDSGLGGSSHQGGVVVDTPANTSDGKNPNEKKESYVWMFWVLLSFVIAFICLIFAGVFK